MSTEPRIRARSALRVLHQSIDDTTRVLEDHHRDRLHCERGCADCCADGLTVFDVEAARIFEEAAERMRGEIPHRPGKCAFLGEDRACRIYESRPYVCRTQGLPLRWHAREQNGESIEFRDICPLNEDGPPLEELAADECWTLGPAEERLTLLQQLHDSRREQRRIGLRELCNSMVTLND